MSLESRGLGHRLVAEVFEFSDKLVKRYDACFFQAIHAYEYFHVGEITVIEDDVVLVEYLLEDYFFVDAHVLEVLHGSS